MKRIISAISALAVVAGLSASCQKEMAPDNNSFTVNSGLTVTATIADNGTKVSYAEDASHTLIPTWVVNDIIIGFDGDENTYGYKVTAVNEGVATLAIITEGDFAGSATVDPADGTQMYMFYAPGKKPSDISGESLTVNIAHQSKDVVSALMMAQATVAGSSLKLSFENKTAIIGIKAPTMATASKNYTGIAVSGTGINTEVKFEINSEGEFVATYQTPGKIIKAVDFTSGTDNKTTATVYIVACPLTTAADLTFTASNGEYFKKTAKTMAAGQYYYMTAATFLAPPAALSGEFTVDKGTDGVEGTTDDVKVRFSRGNLRCNPVGTPGAYTSGIWSFFDKQYECGPAAYDLGHDKEISFFTWGYNATNSIKPAGADKNNVSITSGNLSQEQDWGSQIGDGNTWRTLTAEEWPYLFNTRTASTVCGTDNARYAKATVNSKAGIILLPDTYSHPSGVTALTNINTGNTEFTVNIYNVTDWEKMETAGAVFLPAAGQRNGVTISGVGDNGIYWSSSAYASSYASQFVFFYSGDVQPVRFVLRGEGFSVRLITECQ